MPEPGDDRAPVEDELDALDAETVEDLDVDDDAEDVEGGTWTMSCYCHTFTTTELCQTR